MTDSLSLRCRCGKMTGIATDVSKDTGNHIVCYCDDCQAYAWLLGTDGIVDSHGGTAIFQTTPSRVRITSGTSALRCVRLSAKGMLRFYSGCCRTPIGNMLASARMPFIGLVTSFIGDGVDGRPRDAVVGPVLARIQARFAAPGAPPDAHPTVPLWLMARWVSKFLRGFLTRAHRPSAFFDARSEKPLVVPEVLTPARRDALRQGGPRIDSGR